jgi:3-deoxy-7-phosphoheptulonate synthase
MDDQFFPKRRIWGPMPHYPKVEKYKAPDRGLISIAGPCSVESAEQIHTIAKVLGKLGVKYLRGGLFRAGTYPGNKFGWVDTVLMNEFYRAATENGMQTIIEVLDYHPDSLKIIAPFAHAYQVGARQMQNYTLLRVLGATKRTVFLKRHPGSTLDEFLGAAEHLLTAGLCDPVLIERGSSTHMNHVRWDLSLSMIPAVQTITDIPIIVDASHGTGRRDLVKPMTLAGIAAGADGFLVEVHPLPEKSLSDSDQAYPLDQFESLFKSIQSVKSSLSL